MTISARALLLLGIAASGVAVAQTSSDPGLVLETYVEGLSRPLAIDWLGPDDALVVERDVARVRRIVDGELGSVVYQHANPTDEALLGLAVNGESPPSVFVFVEDLTGLRGNRLERLRWNPATGALEDAQTIWQAAPSGLAHNLDDGGYLLLGPPDAGAGPPVGDGRTLYVVSGYQQKPGQLRNDPNGQPPDDAGVILRILQDGSPASGNPFSPYCSGTTTTACAGDADCPGSEVCRTAVARYWSYGLRNSFGLALDPVTGALWDEENGEDEFDEINRVVPGMNSGWSAVMGFHPGAAGDAAGDAGGGGAGASVSLFEMPGGGAVYRDPELTWRQTTGPTGIAFAWGSAFGPAYDDKLLVADFNEPSRIYAFPLSPDRRGLAVPTPELVTPSELDPFEIATGFAGRAVAIEFGPDGDLYVVEYFSGVIHRLRGPGRPIPVFGRLPAGSGVFGLLAGLIGAALGWRRITGGNR